MGQIVDKIATDVVKEVAEVTQETQETTEVVNEDVAIDTSPPVEPVQDNGDGEG